MNNPEIIKSNLTLIDKYRLEFHDIFGIELNECFDLHRGFLLADFEMCMNLPRNKALNETIVAKYGQDALILLENLILGM